MIVRPFRRAGAVTVVAAAFFAGSTPAAASCDARIVSQKAPVADYDPFAAVDHVQPAAVSIENVSNSDCVYALTLMPTGDVADLRFELQDTQGDLLAESEGSTASTSRLISPTLAPGDSHTFQYQAVLPAGQLLASGRHERPLDILLSGQPDQPPAPDAPPLERTPSRLAATVADRLSVNIAGAGKFKTVDFGTLAEGEARRVVIEARGNRNFSLDISSRNEAALTLKTPDRSWHIDYSVTLGGASLGLPATIGPFAATSVAGTSFDFSFVIGDVSGAHAGLYTDEITVAIRPAL